MTYSTEQNKFSRKGGFISDMSTRWTCDKLCIMKLKIYICLVSVYLNIKLLNIVLSKKKIKKRLTD